MHPPSSATLADLIKLFRESTPQRGRTQRATLDRLQKRLGKLRLVVLSGVHLRDYIDYRQAEGAGGVTIAQDLSFLATVLDWGRHVRQLDLQPELARDARRSLKHQGLKTRSKERDRVPTEEELERLYARWRSNPRQSIPMELLCRFAVASAMRLGEIAG